MFGRATIRLGIGPHSSFLVFATCFILCITDTDDVALLELQVAVLSILHLRLC